MKILYADYTDVGGRGNNEDSLAVAVADHGHLFLVADGLGGHDNGEEASDLAVKEIKRRFLEEGESFDPERAIKAANDVILAKQEEEGSSMKTTITLAWIRDTITCFAHVGDSRIYAFDKNGIVYQSPDHSVSYLAVAMGEITVAEIRNHRDRNKLTRALGVSEDVSVHLNTVNNSDYMGILLCSDGLWEYVYEEEMVSLLSSVSTPGEWIEKMRELHAQRVDGKHDNNTAVAVITDGYSAAAKSLETTRAFAIPTMSARPSSAAPVAQPIRQSAPAPRAAAPVSACIAPSESGGEKKPKKGNKTVKVLVILCLVLLLVIAGLLAGMFLLDKKDKNKDKKEDSEDVSVESRESGEESFDSDDDDGEDETEAEDDVFPLTSEEEDPDLIESEEQDEEETDSEDESFEGESLEDSSSEDESSEDTSSEDESSEDTSSEDEHSEDTSSEDSSSEDKAFEDESFEGGVGVADFFRDLFDNLK